MTCIYCGRQETTSGYCDCVPAQEPGSTNPPAAFTHLPTDQIAAELTRMNEILERMEAHLDALGAVIESQ